MKNLLFVLKMIELSLHHVMSSLKVLFIYIIKYSYCIYCIYYFSVLFIAVEDNENDHQYFDDDGDDYPDVDLETTQLLQQQQTSAGRPKRK